MSTAFLQSLSKMPPQNFYYFYGEESFLIQEAVARLKKLSLGEGPEDFNFDVFYAPEKSLQEVLDVSETLPMFSPKRLVIWKNVKDLNARDQELLLSYLKKDVDTTCLVFIGKKPDSRKKIFAHLKKTKQIVEFAPLKLRELDPWIEVIAKRHGKGLDREAKELLLEKVGTSLSLIEIEIQKAVNSSEEKWISKEVLQQTLSKHRLESVFDLAKAIGQRDRLQSLSYLAQLLDQGENEIAILALIARHMRILNIVKEGQGQGLNASQLASRAGVPPFYLKQYQQQAALWDVQHLDQIHQALVLTDKALKSSPISSPIWLENFVLKVCES